MEVWACEQWGHPKKRSNGNKTSLCSHENLPVNRCQVLSFYLNFGLQKKGNRVNTQGLQSSCGTPPSKQENYTVRLPGCPDFTLPGLGFRGWDPVAPIQQLIQPFAGATALPAFTQVALTVSGDEERHDLSSPQMMNFVQAAEMGNSPQGSWV